MEKNVLENKEICISDQWNEKWEEDYFSDAIEIRFLKFFFYDNYFHGKGRNVNIEKPIIETIWNMNGQETIKMKRKMYFTSYKLMTRYFKLKNLKNILAL